MLSQTSKTAIKAVIYLALQSDKGDKSAIKDIARHIAASEHTVGKALQKLAKAQIIKSSKGPNGGFYLEKSQLDQPILDIIQCIEGDELFEECGLGLHQCSAEHPCPIHHEYKVAREMIKDIFTQKKIKDLHTLVNDGYAYLIN